MVPPSPDRQPYQVVARRFRPQTFAEMVGQEEIVRGLQVALESAHVPHAFLFSGSRGVGKTTLARILARALNCEAGPTAEPCGECSPCRSILESRNPDVIEIDAASHNLVDDIRELRDRVGFASMGCRYKVYILDEAHMLTRSAFNAFLKTLEEPPPNVVFILATTELHKLPETIRSRCQVMLFRRLGEADITRRLRMICDCEEVPVPEAILQDISSSCRGGMRDAETALEQVLPVAREMGEAFNLDTYRGLTQRVGQDRAVAVVENMLRGEVAPALQFAADVERGGIDERESLGEVLDILRSLLLLVVDGQDTGLVQLGDGLRQRLGKLAGAADMHRLDAMIQAGLIGRDRIRRLEDRRLVLEVTLLRMASAGQLPTLGALAAGVESGVAVTVPSPPGAESSPPGPGASPPGTVSSPPGTVSSLRGAVSSLRGAESSLRGVESSLRGQGAAPAGPAQAGPRDLRERLMKSLEAAKPMLVRTIELCRLSGPDADGAVTVELEKPSRLHRDRLESQDVRSLLRKLLSDLTEREVRVVVRFGDGGNEPAPKRREPGLAVRKVAEKFDGQILDVDDHDLPQPRSV